MVYQLLTTTEVMGSSYKLKNQLISKIITAEACFPLGFIPPFGPIFLSLIFELNQMNLKSRWQGYTNYCTGCSLSYWEVPEILKFLCKENSKFAFLRKTTRYTGGTKASQVYYFFHFMGKKLCYYYNYDINVNNNR